MEISIYISLFFDINNANGSLNINIYFNYNVIFIQ